VEILEWILGVLLLLAGFLCWFFCRSWFKHKDDNFIEKLQLVFMGVMIIGAVLLIVKAITSMWIPIFASKIL
jgi:membrane-associated HD superfamily phosphohydrolase